MQLCELISKKAPELQVILSCLSLQNVPDCESLIREGIRKYKNEVGKLWICLAEYHVRLADFDRAREVFEEALRSIVTARDFGIVFNAYMKLEEQLVDLEEDDSEDSEDEEEKGGKNRVLTEDEEFERKY